MARRRTRPVQHPQIEVTFKSGETETMLLTGESSTGKSIRVIRADGTVSFLRKDQITYEQL